jgi:hypothetical protein
LTLKGYKINKKNKVIKQTFSIKLNTLLTVKAKTWNYEKRIIHYDPVAGFWNG